MQYTEKELSKYSGTIVLKNSNNSPAITIKADNLAQAVGVAGLLRKRTESLIETIFDKTLAIFLKESNLKSIKGHENEFEYYVSDSQTPFSLRSKIKSKTPLAGEFMAEVVFESNSGVGDLIGLLPDLLNAKSINAAISKTINS